MLFACYFEPGQCSKSSRYHDLQGHGVRSGFCALSVSKLPALITAYWNNLEIADSIVGFFFE
ncbi:Uncharacterised protein [Yersinia pekkanenii]|uniref:Uncharacterized protein n=1 Tax=Yersinia pekkanenii TaxID=1288385 RepID=A0A0T9NEW3_9GAMM|nr:Uncharacterised protein [Yersinia pekkanenii]CRY63947.1 Uncharacterised protein [Yersinia pekkanenii]